MSGGGFPAESSPGVTIDVVKEMGWLNREQADALRAEVRRLRSELEEARKNVAWSETMRGEALLGFLAAERRELRIREALTAIVASREGPFLATSGEGHARCVEIAARVLSSAGGGDAGKGEGER